MIDNEPETQELDAATAFEAGVALAELERGAARNAGKVARALIEALGTAAQSGDRTAQETILEANRTYTKEEN